MRVLGVDPGTSVTGWAVVESDGPAAVRRASGRLGLASASPLAERLRRIHETIAGLLRDHAPAALALEKAFVSRNVQSAFRLGEARGAVLVAAAAAGVPVFEYAPAAVKLAVVGYGRADKTQMVRGVALRLGVVDLDSPDEADALAVALCHLQGARLRELKARGSSAKVQGARLRDLGGRLPTVR